MSRIFALDYERNVREIAVEAVRAAGSCKEVARMVGRNPRTVETWRSGTVEPPSSAILTLMMKSQAAAAVLLGKLGFHDCQMDREEAELLDQLAILRAERLAQGRPEGRALRFADRALALAEKLRPAE